MTGYDTAALAWFDAGFDPLPLPAAKKFPVPEGFTGYDGQAPSRKQIKEWISEGVTDATTGRVIYEVKGGNLALRCPADCIGIDVDAYENKHGDATLALLEEKYGELPATHRTTSRGKANPSGIRWFRIREGATFPGVLGEGIEVIQHHHRYGVVWPSINPKNSKRYETYDDETGEKVTGGVFSPGDLAELPEQWYEAESERGIGLNKATQLDSDEVKAWLADEANAAAYCRAMRNVLNTERAKLESAADTGESRYDTARDGVMALVRLAQEGHRGVARALRNLRALYDDTVADETDRDPGEWRRMLHGAVEAVIEDMEDAHPSGACPDRAVEREADPSLWPSPKEPFDVAERFAAERYRWEGSTDTPIYTLARWRGGWYVWTGTHWVEHDSDTLAAELYRLLNRVSYMSSAQQPTELRWNPDKTKIGHVLDALGALLHRAGDVAHAGGAVPMANGVLDLQSRELSKHTPERFNLSSLPFDFDVDSPDPKEWFAFLDSLELDEDEERLLRQWFGYVISGETRKQKMMLLLGQPRAGKGVITRTLHRLVGRDGVASPTLDQFATNFGLQSCIGKSLITIADARFGGRSGKPVIEKLLNISGGDPMQIDRKNKNPWEGVLPGRIMIVSNDLPQLSGEASSALSSRFIGPIELTNSFLGQEDEQLEDRIAGELGGIFWWALGGYDDLIELGRFTRPARSVETARELAESMSPLLSFLHAACELDPSAGKFVGTDELYRAYERWSAREGRQFVSDRARFARELRIAAGNQILAARRGPKGGHRVPGYRGISLIPGAYDTNLSLDSV